MSREQAQGDGARLAGAAREASRPDRAGPPPARLEGTLHEVVERLALARTHACDAGRAAGRAEP